MYTGIILHNGKIAQIVGGEKGGKRMRIDVPAIAVNLSKGASVNVNGVCLTVTDFDDQGFFADVMPQTLALTTMADWTEGQQVNVEPSLRVGDELGGHFVYGHVDGVATIVERKENGNALIVSLRLPAELRKCIVPQGSVALDGVSLTVADVRDDLFTVSLIPETVERTTFAKLEIGDRVNFEADMLMKYVQQGK